MSHRNNGYNTTKNTNGHKNGTTRFIKSPAASKSEVTMKLPEGFECLCEIPKDVGGGWLCTAPVERLKTMCPKWNPSGRTNEDAFESSLKSLQKSINAFGLNQFPVVNDTTMVDGNRRTAACDLAGKERIPVLYRPWATASTYADVNQEQKKHTPTQKQETWLEEPSAVTQGFNKRMMDAVAVLDMELVVWVIKQKRNVISTLNFARRALKYCQPTGNPKTFLRRAVKLQVKSHDVYTLRTWIEERRSPSDLAERIKKGRSLKS